MRKCRKASIMGDAAHVILSRNSREVTGKFLLDDVVLKEHGVTDFDQYANIPGAVFCFYLGVCVCVRREWCPVLQLVKLAKHQSVLEQIPFPTKVNFYAKEIFIFRQKPCLKGAECRLFQRRSIFQ